MMTGTLQDNFDLYITVPDSVTIDARTSRWLIRPRATTQITARRT
jgi:hypothetical protein